MASKQFIECGNCNIEVPVHECIKVYETDTIIALKCPECDELVEQYGKPINKSCHIWYGDKVGKQSYGLVLGTVSIEQYKTAIGAR